MTERTRAASQRLARHGRRQIFFVFLDDDHSNTQTRKTGGCDLFVTRVPPHLHFLRAPKHTTTDTDCPNYFTVLRRPSPRLADAAEELAQQFGDASRPMKNTRPLNRERQIVADKTAAACSTKHKTHACKREHMLQSHASGRGRRCSTTITPCRSAIPHTGFHASELDRQEFWRAASSTEAGRRPQNGSLAFRCLDKHHEG